MAQSADGAHDTAETVLLLVNDDMPGIAAAFAQCPSTGAPAAAAVAGCIAIPASASDAPATVAPTNTLILLILMPAIVAAGAETPLKRR
jgi:hypothetical protein